MGGTAPAIPDPDRLYQRGTFQQMDFLHFGRRRRGIAIRMHYVFSFISKIKNRKDGVDGCIGEIYPPAVS